MAHDRKLNLLHSAMTGITSSKQTTRAESLENINSYLVDPSIKKSLGSDPTTGPNLFKAVRTTLDMVFCKLEKGNKGVSERELRFSRDCCDTIMRVVKATNSQSGLISLTEYLVFVKDCVRRKYHREYCLPQCICTLKESFLTSADYWIKLSLSEVMSIITLLKEAHTVAPVSDAFVCYTALIEEGIHYKVPLKLVSDEFKYLHEIALQVKNTRDHNWLLRSVIYALYQFSKICGCVYKEVCTQQGEKILAHSMMFITHHEKSEEGKTILLETLTMHLEFHMDCAPDKISREWSQIVSRITVLIGHWIDTKDAIAFTKNSGSSELTPIFRKLVVALFKQCKLVSVPEEGPSAKRLRTEPGFMEIVENIDKTLNATWISIFTAVIGSHPEHFSRTYLQRSMNAFLNEVKIRRCRMLQGAIFRCFGVLLEIEDKLEADASETSNMDVEWSSVLEIALRTAGLNQNEAECHALLQSLFILKTHLIEVSSTLLNLYISNPMLQTPETLASLNVFASNFIFPESIGSFPSVRKSLIDLILDLNGVASNKSLPHIHHAITAEVLTNITFKYWRNHRSLLQSHVTGSVSILNNDVFRHLQEGLETMQTKLPALAVEQSESVALVISLRFTLLLANLSFHYRQCQEGSLHKAIDKYFMPTLSLVWEQLKHFLAPFKEVDASTLVPPLTLVYDLLRSDEHLDHLIKQNIPEDIILILVKMQCDIALDTDTLEEPRVQAKLILTKIFTALTVYDIPQKNEKQIALKRMFYQFEGFSPHSPIDFAQWIILSEGLAHPKCFLSAEHIDAILNLLRDIFQQRCEHNVVAGLVQTLCNLFPHLVQVDEGRDVVIEQGLQALKMLHEKRLHFGHLVSLNLVKCLGLVAQLDSTFTWAKIDNNLCILHLLDYIDHEHVLVHQEIVNALCKVFEKAIFNSKTYEVRITVFTTIIEKLKQVMSQRNGKEVDKVGCPLVIDILARLAVADNGNAISKMSICALFELYTEKTINNCQLEKGVRCMQQSLKLSQFLKPTLEIWMSKHTIVEFPCEIYDSCAMSEFYARNLRIIVPLLLKNNRRQELGALCEQLDRNCKKDIEDCHVIIIAEDLVVNSAERSTGEHQTLLDCDVIKKALNLQPHELVFETLQFLYDPKHFDKMFNPNLCMPIVEGPILTWAGFQRIWSKLGDLVEMNFTKYLSTKPSNVQKILLALRSNLSQGKDSVSNSLHFYRYVAFLKQMLPLRMKFTNIATYLIRDVLYALINIIKHQDFVLGAQAIKFMSTFLKNMLHTHPGKVSEFAIVVCSTLMPHAATGNEDALKVLKQIFYSKNLDIDRALKHLDPLPLNNSHLQELRRHHLTFRRTDCTLEEEIALFLAGKEFIDCRIEGLKYLRRKISSDLVGRKEIYESLQTQEALKKDGLLHQIICTLVELTKSQNPIESREAILCLGVLGAGDLSSIILHYDDDVPINEDVVLLFISKLLDLLHGYAVDADANVAKLAATALCDILETREGQKVLKNKDASIQEYLAPFVMPVTHTCSVSADLRLHDPDVRKYLTHLWYPSKQSTTFQQWISDLCIECLKGIHISFAALLIPLIEAKLDFAVECFPYILNLISNVNQSLRTFVLEGISKFLCLHWDSIVEKSESFATNKAATRAIVHVLFFIRLQDSCRKRRSHLGSFHVNYFHAAIAAQNCSAHLSALMYAEKYLQAKTKSGRDSAYMENMLDSDDSAASILYESYTAIGDDDALEGCKAGAPLDQPAPRYTTNQPFELTKCDCALENNGLASVYNLAQAHINQGLYKSALAVLSKYQTSWKSPSPFDEMRHESLWRLSAWDELTALVTPRANTGFETNVYNVLEGIKDMDQLRVRSALEHARLEVADSLKNISLECCKTVYGPLSQLERLQELEDAFETALHNGSLSEWSRRCDLRDDIQYKFEYLEPRLAQRIEALNLLKRANYPNAAALNSAVRLKLAEIACNKGQFNIAMRQIEELKSMPSTLMPTNELAEIEGTTAMLETQILWSTGKLSDGRTLKDLLKTHTEPTHLRASMLRTYGDWMAKYHAAYPQKIIDEYYLESVRILEKLHPRMHPDAKQNLYCAIAKFADEQYQQTIESIASPEFAYKIKSMNRMVDTAKKLRAQVNNSEYKRASVTFERFASVDNADIKNKYREKSHYLTLAVKYYLLHIKHSSMVDNKIFRIFSLWLENRSDEIARDIEKSLQSIETFKILPIVPQLVPHIVGDDEQFVRTVRALVERCAIDHPYHVIPLILCVANTNEDDKYSPDNAKIVTNEGRILMAQEIIGRLSKIRKLSGIVKETKAISSAIIELAYYQTNTEKFTLPRTLQVSKLGPMKYGLIPTCVPPVRTDLDYSNVVTLHKFKLSGSLVGGVNRPKRIECVGSDGIVRTLLVKSKDDLRQDAVMQQVFSIMNEFFRENKDTRHLRIRTYKVIPMSKRSGVLEWVQNSTPLGGYLVSAHREFHPKEWDLVKARLYIHEAGHASHPERLHAYTEVCKNVTPVFHKFFETTYPHPAVWYERRRTYVESVATSSMCGYILGIGDRHVANILIDTSTGELVHIDFGIAFEQGIILPTPETVPFRLTRDIIDGMGVCGVDGTFRRCCEKAMETLRRNAKTIQTIVEVLLYDPLYSWCVSPKKALSKQLDEASCSDPQLLSEEEETQTNVSAQRALSRLKQKLKGADFGNEIDVKTQVDALIQQATDPEKLSRMFSGWQAFM